jgi:hypothetical protein
MYCAIAYGVLWDYLGQTPCVVFGCMIGCMIYASLLPEGTRPDEDSRRDNFDLIATFVSACMFLVRMTWHQYDQR